MDKILIEIAKYAAMGKLATEGITALIALIKRLEGGEVSYADIDKEIATTEEWVKQKNERDEKRLSGGT